MKRKYLLVSLFSGIALVMAVLGSCTKDEGKRPVSNTSTTGSTGSISGCDTITYNKHIKTVINNNCALSGCHGDTQSPVMTSYSLVKNQASRIKARSIDHNPSMMPPDIKDSLTTAEKQLINCWVSNGMKE